MSAPTRRIDVDLEFPYQALIAQFKGQERKVGKAIDRAIRKTIRWMRKALIKLVAAEAKIPQKSIRLRVKDTVNQKDKYGSVWLGLNPVSAHYVGRPRETPRGVNVGRRHRFESAFFQRVFRGNEKKVYRRVFRGAGSSQRGKGDGRFPVELMTIPIDDIGEESAKKIQREAKVRFVRTLTQELNYALNVEGSVRV